MNQLKLAHGSKPFVRPFNQLPDDGFLSKVMSCDSQESRVSDDSANSSFYLPSTNSLLQKVIPETEAEKSHQNDYWWDDEIPDDFSELPPKRIRQLVSLEDQKDVAKLLSLREVKVLRLFCKGGCTSGEAAKFLLNLRLSENDIPTFV